MGKQLARDTKKSTSLYLDKQIWRDFKGECAKAGFFPAHLVEGFMADKLREWSDDKEVVDPCVREPDYRLSGSK